ncbi:hypothetical protein RGJ01_001206 [Serratia marcescens]
MNKDLQTETKEEREREDSKEREEDLIERATLLFEYQKEQYEAAIDGYRRLEDKLQKLFGILGIIITTVVLIIRYWYKDLFPGIYEPFHLWCQIFLGLFVITVFLAWGFTFSGMQPRVLERPDSSNELTPIFMGNKRKDILTTYAEEYSRLTGVIDVLHAEKVGIMKKCSEVMLIGAWLFVVFLCSFIILKANFKDDTWQDKMITNGEMNLKQEKNPPTTYLESQTVE